MSIYAIGEIHGGYPALLNVLDAIAFDQERDVLWFTGNLVSAGEDAVSILRFVKELGRGAVSVLGNSDLTLLSIAEGIMPPVAVESFDNILNAPDRDDLLKWLRQCPLLHYDRQSNWAMVHAGIPAEWSISQASTFAIEAETALTCGDRAALFDNMRGNPPRRWNAKLRGWKRLHFIVSAFARLHTCNPKGYMDFGAGMPANAQVTDYIPWYEIPGRATATIRIICANKHNYQGNHPNIYPLLPGTVEGGLPGILKIPTVSPAVAACR